MSDITVLQRTQIITVDPASSSVSVTNAGPMGPRGPEGTGIVDSIVAGDNIIVDASDAHNPIVSVELDTDLPPNPHAASHGNGGSDEISIDGTQITTGLVADARIASTIARDSEVTTGLATKANTSHTHAQSDITGLAAALSAKANTSALGTAAAAAITDFDASGAASAALASANAYTDAAVLDVEIAGGGVVDSIIAGPGISINNTDPSNPIITNLGGVGGGGSTWELQPYSTVDDLRVEADHVIWYPTESGLGDPVYAVDDADLLFRDGPSTGGGGGIESVVEGEGIVIDITDPDNPIISVESVVDAATVAAAGALMRAGGVMTGDIAVSGGAGFVGPSGATLPIVAPGSGAEIRLVVNAITRLLVNETSVSLPGSMQLFLAVNPSDPMHAVPLQYLTANYQLKAPVPNSQSGTTYTLVLTDAGKAIMFDSAGATTVTVPPNSDVAFPIGMSIDLIQTGTGQVTVVAGSGVTMNKSMPTAKARARYSVLTLIKLDTNYWVLTGDAAAT